MTIAMSLYILFIMRIRGIKKSFNLFKMLQWIEKYILGGLHLLHKVLGAKLLFLSERETN